MNIKLINLLVALKEKRKNKFKDEIITDWFEEIISMRGKNIKHIYENEKGDIYQLKIIKKRR